MKRVKPLETEKEIKNEDLNDQQIYHNIMWVGASDIWWSIHAVGYFYRHPVVSPLGVEENKIQQ
jgi:hypothetical protein